MHVARANWEHARRLFPYFGVVSWPLLVDGLGEVLEYGAGTQTPDGQRSFSRPRWVSLVEHGYCIHVNSIRTGEWTDVV